HPVAWSAWNARATQAITRNMAAAAPAYLRALGEGHPYVSFLGARLGFRFDLRRQRIAVPPMKELFERLTRLRQGLTPARLVVTTARRMQPVFFGEEPPAGSIAPTRLLSGGEWLRFLAQGIQVIDEPEVLLPNLTYTEHSLVHMATSLRHFDFGHTLRFRAQ